MHSALLSGAPANGGLSDCALHFCRVDEWMDSAEQTGRGRVITGNDGGCGSVASGCGSSGAEPLGVALARS